MRDGWFKKAILSIFFAEGSDRPILRGYCFGMLIRISRWTPRSMLLGYEEDHQRFLSSKVRPGMVVYDIGANSGQYALFFSKRVGSSGTVISFEPHPNVFEELCYNVRLNGLANVSTFKAALGDREGVADFLANSNSASMGRLESVEKDYVVPQADRFTVDVKTMDGFQGQIPPPDLLKIDTEGAAAVILKGGAQTIARYKPLIYVELHGPEEQAGVQELMQKGYRFETLDGKPVKDIVSEWHSQLWGRAE